MKRRASTFVATGMLLGAALPAPAFAALCCLEACSHAAVIVDPEPGPPLPGWLAKGSGAFNDHHGVGFYGLGLSQGIRNPAMRRHNAESSARAEVAAVVAQFLTRLTRRLFPSPAPGAASPTSSGGYVCEYPKETEEMKEVTWRLQSLLGSARILDDHVAADGSESTLFFLDLAGYLAGLEAVDGLHPAMRALVREQGPAVFFEMAAERARAAPIVKSGP